jgi:succinate-semialdehyde dehydrogenase/glutarate-semialdehyde dehydrogenase
MTQTITTINPATGAELSHYDMMTGDEVNAAITACHTAFEAWRDRPVAERAEVIRAIGGTLRARKDELAELMTAEMGKLVSQCRDEIELCAGICDWTAEQGPEGGDRGPRHGRGKQGRQGVNLLGGELPDDLPFDPARLLPLRRQRRR